ncbi:piwi-like protein 1 isoform X1 [Dinothrombium tinctorium]|uniref:Piwi-like protein 1 isoform X1 n=1 Tax=Dinothrombium tinctorium TaxID=1965070 RepID=A0A3S4RJA6_9ACAR|nr:piwi-like protein 1 isoform X1 [Dinothrombium tinctorium]
MSGKGRGAGRGQGRGMRLAEALQKLQASQVGGDDRSSTEEQSPASSTSEASTESSPPAASPPAPVVPVIGRGRGKIKQFILKKPEEESQSSPSGSGESSPTSESSPAASPPDVSALSIGEGAEGPSQPRAGPSQQRDQEPPPIENKVVGTEGRPLDVAVNYVRLNRKKDTGVFEYHVDFDPLIDSRNTRFRILRSRDLEDVIGNVIQFTGINLYLPIRLQDSVTVVSTVMPTDNSPVDVKITFVKEPPSAEMIPFFNTMFRRVMRILRMVQIQRHHYDPTMRVEIPQHKLEVWPGVVCAILEYDGGLMLNCDVSHRVLRTNTAREILQEILLHPEGRQKFHEMAQKRLVGCVVLTRYNNKPYRVDDIAFNQNPESTFTLANGQEISYVDYFKNHWNIDIKDKRQPLLVHRPKAKKGQMESPMICLIPELSYMTGLTDDIRSDTRAMRDIASHTRIKPMVRYQKLQQFIQNVNTNEEARRVLEDWGFEFENNPVRTNARQIRPEVLYFGNNKSFEANAKAEWSNDARNSSLLEAKPIERWVLVFTKRDAIKADEFIRMMQQVARPMGFNLANPKKIEIRDEFPATYVGAIKENSAGAQLVMILTPGSSQREDRYSAIKRLCCSEMPVPSQVVRANTITGPKMRAVCQNIALQITCKLGGQLWAIKIPFQSCMIVGMDVYHDASMKGRSVVGVVASLNSMSTRWFTRVYFQNQNEEIASILKNAMVACLKKFYETNNSLPARIFIFRDGVGDGQLNVVRNFEIPQIEEAISDYVKFFQNVKPTISVVIVQKRINLKMAMRRGNEMDNPGPGSIIDHTVTRRSYYNFYLISQHVTQGTVTPTHYITLYDNNNMTPDRMQRITYKLTYLYYNFPATIRVPAPCLYAHKAANLIGQFVKRLPSDTLCDKLFYL